MKYIFKQIDNISGHNAETTVEFSADYLPDILQHFEMFLRGSGFHQSGTLDFVDYEDGYTTPKFECAEEDYEDDDVEDDEETLLNSNSTGPSVMAWTAEQLIHLKSTMQDVCSVCKIDTKTMLSHECWDKNCPKGKDAN
jgi:hypothetical protein